MRDSFKAMYLDNLNRGLRYPGGRIKFTSPAVQPALINHTREFNYAVHHAVRLAPAREKSIISGAVPPQLCDSVKRFAPRRSGISSRPTSTPAFMRAGEGRARHYLITRAIGSPRAVNRATPTRTR